MAISLQGGQREVTVVFGDSQHSLFLSATNSTLPYPRSTKKWQCIIATGLELQNSSLVLVESRIGYTSQIELTLAGPQAVKTGSSLFPVTC